MKFQIIFLLPIICVLFTQLVKADDECGGIIYESQGLLVYSYNKPFPDESCLWMFTSKNGSELGGLEFTLLANGFTKDDYYDHLKIFYIAKNGSIVYARSLGGVDFMDPVTVPSQIVFVSFAHYNKGNAATGFIVQFKGVEVDTPEGEENNTNLRDTGRFYADFEDSSKRNFSYPPKNDISWDPNSEYVPIIVHNRNVSRDGVGIQLRVDNLFMLGRCDNDALNLYGIRDTGYAFTWSELGKICSNGPVYDITLPSGLSLIAVFKSDDERQYDNNAFRLSWS